MGWVQIVNDSFTHANTSVGSANSTTGVPTTGGGTGPWTDVAGGIWNIQSDALNGTTSSITGYETNFLLRPSAENHLNAQIVTTGVINTGGSLESILRYQSASQNCYHFDCNFHNTSGNVAIYSRIGGSFTLLGSSASVTFTNGHNYTIDCTATGASPTTLTMVVTDTTTSTVVASLSTTDSTSGLQVAGGYALTNNSASGSTTMVVTNITTYTEDPQFSLSPNLAVPSTNVSVTATGSNTAWTTGTTFNVSGGSGASISGLSVNTGAQTATFTLHPGSASGTLTISDSTDSATATVTVASVGFSVSPTTAVTGASETITATGAGTAWVNGTTTFSVSGGSGASISSLSINNGTQVATFTLAPGSAAGTLTISDSTDSATANITVYAPTFGVSPTNAILGTPETIIATGSHTSWVLGTGFTVSGGTGASISGVSVNVGAQTATFTLNPGSATGVLTIADTTDSATASVTVSVGSFTIPPTSTARLESPGFWVNAAGGRTGGSSRQTWHVGSWVSYTWTTSSASPAAVLQMSNPGGPSAGSEISVVINGVQTDGLAVPASGGISLNSLLSGAGTYTVVVWYRNTTADNWWDYGNCLVDAGLTVDGYSTAGTAPSARPWALIVGDSVSQGWLANAGNSDFMVSYTFLLSQMLNQLGYDTGVDVCAGLGVLIAGDSDPTGDVPAWYLVSGGTYEPASSSWNKIDGSNSLLDSSNQISSYGSTGTAPALILVNLGANDVVYSASTTDLATAVADSLASLRAAAPNAQIRFILFFSAYTGASGFYSAATAAPYVTAIRNGIAAYISANPTDTKVGLIDLGSVASTYLQYLTANNIHPQVNGHAFAGSTLAGLVAKALTSTGGSSAVFSPVNGCSFIQGV